MQVYRYTVSFSPLLLLALTKKMQEIKFNHSSHYAFNHPFCIVRFITNALQFSL